MKNIIFIIFITVLLSFCCFLYSPSFFAFAETDFSQMNVIEDLSSSSEFNLTDYPFNEFVSAERAFQIINFVEYCYSFKSAERVNYGLYLYIYNPTALSLVETSILNRVKMAVSWDETGAPDDWEYFSLQFCNKSSGDYSDLYFKYRVVDHVSGDNKTIAQRVNSSLRRYDISSFELQTVGQDKATEYFFGGTYKFQGYAEGYGSAAETSTLTCTSYREQETIALNLESTFYRTASSDASRIDGLIPQNQLNTVYFSVPEYFFENYGNLQEVKCEWREFMTSPIIITEHEDLYNAVYPYLGVYLGAYNPDIGFYIYQGLHEDQLQCHGFNVPDIYRKGPDSLVIDPLAYLYYTNGIDVTEFSMTGETLRADILSRAVTVSENTYRIGNIHVPKYLFSENLDPAYPELASRKVGELYSLSINAGDTYNLLNYDNGGWNNFWYELLYGSRGASIENLKAIEVLDASSLSISDEAFELTYYVDTADVSAVKTYVSDALSNSERPVLLRFSERQYYYNRIYSLNESLVGVLGQSDQNYIVKMSVFMDFDIIHLTFSRAGEYKVIPAVSSPIDIVADIDPLPVGSFGGGDNILAGLMRLIGFVLLAVILIQLLPYILKFIASILKFPFELFDDLNKKNKS